MSRSTGKTHCITCGKEKVAYLCEGCSQTFCYDHLGEHRHTLGKRLDEIDDKCNSFRAILIEQKSNPKKHSLIQQINQWKIDSIKKIEQTAEESEQVLVPYITKHIHEIEIKLAHLARQLKESRDENDFDEIHLNEFTQKLRQFEEQLAEPSDISIKEVSSSYVTKLSAIISPGKCVY